MNCVDIFHHAKVSNQHQIAKLRVVRAIQKPSARINFTVNN